MTLHDYEDLIKDIENNMTTCDAGETACVIFYKQDYIDFFEVLFDKLEYDLILSLVNGSSPYVVVCFSPDFGVDCLSLDIFTRQYSGTIKYFYIDSDLNSNIISDFPITKIITYEKAW